MLWQKIFEWPFSCLICIGSDFCWDRIQMEITNLKTQVETYLLREDFLVPKGSSPSVVKINFKFCTYLTNQQLCGIRAIPSLQT